MLSKKYINASEYDVIDGLNLLKKTSKVRFIESVDVAINLGIDARKSDQVVRGNVILPHGIGRNVRVAVFTQGMNVELAREAGADLVGLEELSDQIKNKKCRLDVVVATPDVMNFVGKLGSFLGPKGLMPTPKMGTVSHDIVKLVKNIKLGQIRYRNDKGGVVHTVIGKVNFDVVQLQENLLALISSLIQMKPIQCKKTYIEKVFISTTMGRSIIINKNSLCI